MVALKTDDTCIVFIVHLYRDGFFGFVIKKYLVVVIIVIRALRCGANIKDLLRRRGGGAKWKDELEK